MVLIDMEMPQNCEECRLMVGNWCYGLTDDDERGIGIRFDRRPDFCPLVYLSDGLYQVEKGKIWKYQGKGKKHGKAD